MNNLKDNLIQTSKVETGRAAVTGATLDVVAAKQQVSNTLAHAAVQIAAQGSLYKDNVMNCCMSKRQSRLGQQNRIN